MVNDTSPGELDYLGATFRIKGEPPTKTEIDSLRHEAQNSLRAESRVMIIFGILVFATVAKIIINGSSPVYFYALPVALMALLGFFVHARIADLKKNNLAFLDELDEVKRPAQCIEYGKWMTSDKAVLGYQKKITAQGRRTTMIDYEAAKEWMDAAPERRMLEKAKGACRRMSTM